MKRLFDIIVSIIIILIFFPLGVVIAILISFESKGGPFYIQQRVGLNGKPFGLFKFRTMRKNAEKQGKLTIGMRDQRITKLGYILRKTKLDEFPQFLNVLIGHMSIVGPRPEVQEYVDHYSVEQKEILLVRPGVTDYASLEYFDENKLLGESDNPQKTYIEEIMPAKIKLNRKYLEHPTVGHDIQIMWKTFLRIIR